MASIQVLLDGGLERLTTTRVAGRAGVSVGSLYQYYPNKQSLLAAVLEKHMLKVVEAVEAACLRARGQPSAVMAATVVRAFFDAKFTEPGASRALYAVAAEVGSEEVVERLTQRSQVALSDMLATASDRRFTDVVSMSFLLSTAVVGPVQALLGSSAPAVIVSKVQEHLVAMVAAYLDRIGKPPGVRRRKKQMRPHRV